MTSVPAMAAGPSAAKIAASMFSAPSEACHVDFTPGRYASHFQRSAKMLVNMLYARCDVCSIKKMVLTNFMTHQYLEFVPSSRVNFLLGANGRCGRD
jgi:hypothetical protein